MADTDYGAEDFEFPSLEGLDPAEAATIWDHIERQAREANKRADRLKDRKAVAKDLTLRAVEASPYTSVRIAGANGRENQVTPYSWTVFEIVDDAAFKEWAAGETERYYDDSPRLREGIWLEEMRRRDADREPLPPGVKSWTDTKISRTVVPQRNKRRKSKRTGDQNAD